MKNKPQSNINFGKKRTIIKDDTALEGTLEEDISILRVAKTRLESIIKLCYEHSFKLYVALTKDYIEKNEPKLFYGQIGEILFLPDNETCWVKFYHYENQAESEEPKLIHQLQLPIVDLFPLFFEKPLSYTAKIKECREEFSNIQNNYLEEQYKDEGTEKKVFLASHRESENRVSVNKIVAVGADFTYNEVTICAGQVGRISKILENDLVEVSFKSVFLKRLISEIETDKVTEKNRLDNWVQKIIINKDYLVYLYYKNLDNSGDTLYYQDFIRKWRKDEKVMKKFDPNTYLDSESCIKSADFEDTSDP